PTRSTDLVTGLYKTPAIAVNVKGVCTNTVPVCAYRGARRPEAAYLMERLVDAAARDLGLSPDEIRRRNFIPPSAIPYTSATQITFDSGEFERVMDLCMDNADWPGSKAHRSEETRQAARHRDGDLYRALRRRFSRDCVDRVQERSHRARDGQCRIRHRAHHLLQAARCRPARRPSRQDRRHHGRYRP